MKCKLLEECLFGNSSSISSLPANWLPVELLAREDKIYEDLFKFQQKMLIALKNHEEKKKVNNL